MAGSLIGRGGAFLRLWLASSISSVGARISREGIPLTAVLTLGAGPLTVGVLAAIRAGPAVIAGLAGGAWVDRSERRRLMIGADLLRAGLLIAVPIAALTHHLSLAILLAAAALVGAAGTIFDMASHAYLPSIVAPQQIVAANAALTASDAVAEVAGPGLAGVLISLLGAPVALGINAATYLASAAVLALTPGERAAPAGPSQTGVDIFEGVRLAMAEPNVRPLLLMAGSQALAGGVFSALYLLFAIRTLHLTPAMLGATIAMGGVGSLFGSALTGAAVRRLGFGPAIPLTAWAAAAFTALIPAAGGGPLTGMIVLMGAQLFGDAFATAREILGASARQSLLAPETLGRTAGAFAAVEGAAAVAGALAGGLLGQAFGLRAAMWAAAAGFLLAPLWTLGTPLWRLRKAPQT
ncbi:MAG TPA: MFS transporter [Caulobacteraceae bacterium]|jgi:predicted MFS family arabinose efflux permease|nr:MFS transporter [Caulobacteraceae bacterium]